jgi:hypothetical protein
MPRFREIDGIRYCALTIEQVQDNPDLMQALFERGQDAFSKERFDKLVQLFLMSAKRNNDIITEETIRKTVDMANIADVIRAVLGQPPLPDGPAATLLPSVPSVPAVPTSPQTGGASIPG